MSKSEWVGIEAGEQLRQLIDEEWEVRMREDPLFATMAGDHRYDDRLPQATPADAERRYQHAHEFLARLQALDPFELSPTERLNYDVFHWDLERQAAAYEFRLHLMPLTKMDGIHTFFPDLTNYTPYDTIQDYENYLARLNAFHTFAQQQIELMRLGLQEGFTPPQAALIGVESAFQSLLPADPTQSLFYTPFEQFPKQITESEQTRLRLAGLQTIRNSILPGYRAVLEFLHTEYIRLARTDIAASSLPSGPDFYADCVRSFTTTDLTPPQVHEIGLAEVERIRGWMEAIIQKVGFQGGLHDFIQFLRTDDRFYVATPQALLEKVALILKRMDGELPRLFKKHPRTPYGIRTIPDHIAPQSTTAYYFPPTGDGTRAGFYYVNTYDLRSRPLYELEALSLHEAVPGHHTQLALQFEMADMPNFRRFSNVTAFIEGWALYAERLGLETGFYQDPYSDFGRLTYEMWRACRLVVDTGMHALDWTRQQAIDFMAENSALTLLNIANEVDRYIAWPGQALAYKIGELKIRELRALAEEQLGSAFDLREFHDRLLENGSIPLTALSAHLQRWIAGEKGP